MKTKSIREERIAIARQIMDDIQDQVRGIVECDEDIWIDRYVLKIRTSDYVFCYDITNMVYDIQYEQSIVPVNEKKAVGIIIRTYKDYIFDKYFCNDYEAAG